MTNLKLAQTLLFKKNLYLGVFLGGVFLQAVQAADTCRPQPKNAAITLKYSSPGFDVYRNAYPPNSDDQQGYQYFPLTGNFSGLVNGENLVKSEATSEKNLFLWVNRCNDTPAASCGPTRDKKGNVPVITQVDEGNEAIAEYRFYFSNRDKADACTKGQLLYALNAYTNAINTIENVGVTVVTAASKKFLETSVTSPVTSLDGKTTYYRNSWPKRGAVKPGEAPNLVGYVDMCFLEPSAFTVTNTDGTVERKWLRNAVDGVVLDYEPQDGRSHTRTLNLVDDINNIVDQDRFKKKLILWTNPLIKTNGTTGELVYPLAQSVSSIRNGITKGSDAIGTGGSAHQLLNLVDMVSILAYEKMDSATIAQILREQERIYRPKFRDLAKFYVILGIGNSNAELIENVRNAVLTRPYGGVATWNNNGTRYCDDENPKYTDLYGKQIDCLIDGGSKCNFVN